MDYAPPASSPAAAYMVAQHRQRILEMGFSAQAAERALAAAGGNLRIAAESLLAGQCQEQGRAEGGGAGAGAGAEAGAGAGPPPSLDVPQPAALRQSACEANADAKTARLEELGFARLDALGALAAAGGDIKEATEVLLSGWRPPFGGEDTPARLRAKLANRRADLAVEELGAPGLQYDVAALEARLAELERAAPEPASEPMPVLALEVAPVPVPAPAPPPPEPEPGALPPAPTTDSDNSNNSDDYVLVDDDTKRFDFEVAKGATFDVPVEVRSPEELVSWRFTEAMHYDIGFGLLFLGTGGGRAHGGVPMVVRPVTRCHSNRADQCTGSFRFQEWCLSAAAPGVVPGAAVLFPGQLVLRFDNQASWWAARSILARITAPGLAASDGAAAGDGPGDAPGVAPGLHITVTPMEAWGDLGQYTVEPGERGKNEQARVQPATPCMTPRCFVRKCSQEVADSAGRWLHARGGARPRAVRRRLPRGAPRRGAGFISRFISRLISAGCTLDTTLNAPWIPPPPPECPTTADRTPSGQPVAIKVIDERGLRKTGGEAGFRKALTSLNREVTIMRKLRHPNVLALASPAGSPDLLLSKTHLYLVTELCTGGDLDRLLQTRRDQCTAAGAAPAPAHAALPSNTPGLPFLPWAGGEAPAPDVPNWPGLERAEAVGLMAQLVGGMAHLRLFNVVHRDLKARVPSPTPPHVT
jgi:hypothetical protein